MRFLDNIENAFMKNHSCICCYKEIADETKFMLCKECSDDIEFLVGNICHKCGDKLNSGNTCINDCAKQRYSFRSNMSLCYYTNSASRIIKNFKYGKKKYLGEYIAQMMLFFSDKLKNYDAIAYVPSSKKRTRERGFNQAKVLADILGEKQNIKVLDLIIKTKETTHQAGGTQKDRLKNLSNSFSANEMFAQEVKDKTILIVDDVFTTGSTLNECAKVVKKLGVKKVDTLTFAKTKFNLTSNL